jgi:RHS repeat-associated protein
MKDPTGSESYTFDSALGRVVNLQKVIGSTTYNIGYSYNLAGELLSLTYPSSRIVQQSYDPVGRLCEIAGTAPSTTCGAVTAPYITGIQYNTAQEVTALNYGNGLNATMAYSPDRLQMTSLSYAKGTQTLYGLNYFYKQDASNCPAAPTGNNGQIQCIMDTVDSGRSVAYSYDALGRVSTAATQGSTNYPKWGLSWAYDRYGNRLNQNVTAGTANQIALTVDATTNHITGSSYAYDAGGNMTNDGLNTLVYDAENRTTSSSGSSSSGTYTFDGNGLRVTKSSGGTTTVYIFSGSKVLAEYDNGAAPASPSREYIYAGASLVATISGGTTTYHHLDHLSVRLDTDANGNIVGQQGHYPFGESWYSANSTTKWKFTTYERDPESGNDYAIARFGASRLGRFTAVDPIAGSVSAPQSFNGYSYVANDPVNSADPSGQFTIPQSWFYGFGAIGGGGGFGWNWNEFDALDQWSNALQWAAIAGVDVAVVSTKIGNQPGDSATTLYFNEINTWANAVSYLDQLAGSSGAGSGGGPGGNGSDPGGPYPNPAIAQSMLKGIVYQLRYAVGTLVKQEACGKTPADAMLKSMKSGAVRGTVRGAVAGFAGGEFFGGIGGVPGSILGGFMGGTFGAAGGVIWGGARAGGCSLAGAYGQ